MPLRGEFADQAVDFAARPDVDPARRLVEDQHLGASQQPAADHHLLLVAAAQPADRRLDVGHLDGEVAHGLERGGGAPPPVDQGQRLAVHDPGEVGELQVEGDALGEQQSLGATLLRHEPEPCLDGVGGRVRRERLALQGHGAGIGLVRAIDQARELGPAGTDEASEAEHLAAPEIEADASDPRKPRETADLQRHGARRRSGGGRRQPLDPAPDDRLDQRAARETCAFEGGHGAAVPERRHAAAQPHHLVQPVRHVEDGDAGAGQVFDDAEELLALAGRQRGGRLVHDDETGLADQGAADVDQPVLGRRQTLDGGEQRRRDADLGCDRCDLAGDGAPVDHSEPGRLRQPEHDVLHHRHAGHEGELLVDEVHSELGGPVRGADRDRPAVGDDAAAVGLGKPREHADQRRLAGPVGPHEPVDLARTQRQRHALEGLYAAVGLGDVLDHKERRVGRALRATLGRHREPLLHYLPRASG